MNARNLAISLLVFALCCTTSLPVWSDTGAQSWQKMVFHVDESRNARWALMLANSYLDDNPGAKLAIVTYGPGVDFLLSGINDARGNAFAPAVRKLAARGVPIRICATTLRARDIDEKDVLDVVEIVPSGLSEIARLENLEGYAYIKP